MARYARRRTRRRSAYRKKSGRSRRRMSRKGPARYGGKRIRRNGAWKVYTFQRTVEGMIFNTDPASASPTVVSSDVAAIQVAPSADTTGTTLPNCTNWGGVFRIRAAQMAGWSEFPALFSEYRIKGVKVEMMNPYSGKDVVSATTSSVADQPYPTPTIYWLNDGDPYPVDGSGFVTAFPTMAGINQAQGWKHAKLGKFTQYMRPCPLSTIGVAGTTVIGSAGLMRKAPWITLNGNNSGTTPQIEHYGMKFYLQDWPGPSDGTGVEGDEVPYGVRVRMTYTVQFRGVR